MKWMALACILLVLMAGAGEKTTHFSIKYHDSKAVAGDIGRTLENDYRTVNDLFHDLPASIKVTIVDGDEMDSVGKHVEAYSAWNSHSSTIVLRAETLKNKKSLNVVTTHEITHLALNPILARKGGNDFAWLEEGTCMVVSKEPLDKVKVAKYIVANGFMTLPEIAKAVDDSNYTVCKNGYLQSFSLCQFIADRYGLDTLVDIIECPGANFKDDFRKVTGDCFDPVCQAWKASVADQAQSASLPQGITIHGCLDTGIGLMI